MRDVLPPLGVQVETRATDLNAQELSMCSWAAAQAVGSCSQPSAPPALCRALAAAALVSAPSMDAQQLATAALSLVKLGCTDGPTLKQIARASRKAMPHFGPQDLDNLASAYARLPRWRAPKLVRAIAEAATKAIRASGGVEDERGAAIFPIRNLVNLLWAVAKLSAGYTGVLICLSCHVSAWED